ncbi:hypothetical protein HYFRA_00004421 [Hymenoscyphus fraxineus]|uniref:Uncharacterized protein n=1 Tax=Hymenoscyphus fraxineus TaxID=746836 RepID=A0A9N9KXQ2_9HELO|nr:hypothetical protein HYFRA_00004421 [Hymenoscyphus fraxineus]
MTGTGTEQCKRIARHYAGIWTGEPESLLMAEDTAARRAGEACAGKGTNDIEMGESAPIGVDGSQQTPEKAVAT